jgi:hypothetical protein
MKDDMEWLKILAIVAVFFIIMLVVAGCVRTSGCELEKNVKWSCPDDGEIIVIIPGDT